MTLSGNKAVNPWLVVLALAPGVFLTLADATVMSVAVPLIIRRLEGSVISVSWVMNGYNLVLTVLFLTMGGSPTATATSCCSCSASRCSRPPRWAARWRRPSRP